MTQDFMNKCQSFHLEVFVFNREGNDFNIIKVFVFLYLITVHFFNSPASMYFLPSAF